jgi:hypothetical protein
MGLDGCMSPVEEVAVELGEKVDGAYGYEVDGVMGRIWEVLGYARCS